MIQKSKPFLNAKEIISLFLAPVAPLMLWVWFGWGFFSSEGSTPVSSYALQLQGIIVVFLYMMAAVATLLLGLPLYWLGKRRNAVRWWTCLLVGFLLGCLVGVIFGEVLGMGFFGAGEGLVFWLLWQFWIRLEHQEKVP